MSMTQSMPVMGEASVMAGIAGRSASAVEARRLLSETYGIRTPRNRVAPKDRESWTLPEAAETFGLDYEALRLDANSGLLVTFRPRSRRGTPGWRRVTRKEIERYMSRYEE